jgi:hypothetical protein
MYFVDGILATCVLVASLCVTLKPSRIGDIVVSTALNEIKGQYDWQKISCGLLEDNRSFFTFF